MYIYHIKLFILLLNKYKSIFMYEIYTGDFELLGEFSKWREKKIAKTAAIGNQDVPKHMFLANGEKK